MNPGSAIGRPPRGLTATAVLGKAEPPEQATQVLTGDQLGSVIPFPGKRRSPAAPGDIVCEAIRKRALLEFKYKGYHRVVAPYCHGTSTRNVEVLRAIQVRGVSPSGGYGVGKLWSVSEMVDPRILDETFNPDDPNYNPDDTAMKQIHCRI